MSEALHASSPARLRRLGPADVPLLRALNTLFAAAFGGPGPDEGEPTPDAYLAGLLGAEHIVVLVALVDDAVVGGLVAYELDKVGRMGRELYLYDLAVAATHRRRHIATALIEHLKEIATQRGATVVYVQADHGDDAAIALYRTLGRGKQVFHFDIGVR